MLIKPLGLAVFLAGAAAPLAAQAPAGGTPQPSMQQAFDEATRLMGEGQDPAAAVRAWEALESRARNPRTLALIKLRKGVALKLAGRTEAAAEVLRAALAALPDQPDLAEDRLVGWQSLGQIQLAAIDYAGALASYQAMLKLAKSDGDRLDALTQIIFTGAFVDQQAAQAAFQQGEPLAAKPEVAAPKRGLFLAAGAELALNLQDFATAQQRGMAAVKALGGLTTRTDLLDVLARSDAAIALVRAGNREEARRYMAATGAGRFEKGTFARGRQMDLPLCGTDGLTPDDVAVIEFSLRDDGSVKGVRPVYSSRSGEAGLSFARLAQGWAFAPEMVRDLPTFFRYVARLELRCTNSFAREPVDKPLRVALFEWLTTHQGLTDDLRESESARYVRLYKALALPHQDGPGDAGPLAVLTFDPRLPGDERRRMAARALAQLDAAAPPAARLALMLAADPKVADPARLAAGGVEPALLADPTTRAALYLYAADSAGGSRRAATRALLQQVADDPALPEKSPYKIGALTRLASIAAAQNQDDQAAALYARTGLDAKQCALADAAPKVRQVGNGTFPQEAERWGFEGFTVTEMDVTAKGATANARAVISYPPFIFSDSGVDLAKQTRFAPSYRPTGELGCSGAQLPVRFQLGYGR